MAKRGFPKKTIAVRHGSSSWYEPINARIWPEIPEAVIQQANACIRRMKSEIDRIRDSECSLREPKAYSFNRKELKETIKSADRDLNGLFADKFRPVLEDLGISSALDVAADATSDLHQALLKAIGEDDVSPSTGGKETEIRGQAVRELAAIFERASLPNHISESEKPSQFAMFIQANVYAEIGEKQHSCGGLIKKIRRDLE